MKLAHLVMALAALAPACSRPSTSNVAPPTENRESAAQAQPTNSAEPSESAPSGGSERQPVDYAIGAPRTFENLTVFAITSDKQVDVGPITTLEAALKKQEAEVREVGAETQDAAPTPSIATRHHHGRSSGAQVNTLVIENKGTVPIYVLAGTVVKGGNQDRQIGQDFIIDAKQTTGVDAFCVEHGRWNGERNGRGTEGKFETVTQLVTSSVRAAGQYQQNQGEVWAKVADVNSANKKSAASGTLLATLDDAEVAKHRAALASMLTTYLKTVQPANDVVGIAYAVDGRVRGARWFVNHTVYDLYRETLVNTAAVDAITAAAARGSAKTLEVPPVTPGAVTSFISNIEAAAMYARDTPAANVNEYRETARGYGSQTMMKRKADPAAPPSAPAPKPMKLSSDYLTK